MNINVAFYATNIFLMIKLCKYLFCLVSLKKKIFFEKKKKKKCKILKTAEDKF